VMSATAISPTLQMRVVVQTYVVDAYPRCPAEARHFEIQLAPDDAPDAPRTIVVTRDRQLYERAVKAEATGLTFRAAWHRAKRNNGQMCLVLDVLEVA
jgi:hypothetical protein